MVAVNLRKEGQESSGERHLTDLAQARFCQTATEIQYYFTDRRFHLEKARVLCSPTKRKPAALTAFDCSCAVRSRRQRPHSKSFATRAHVFRRNRQMGNSLRNQTEIQEIRHEKSSDFIEGAETNAGIGSAIEDADTMLGTIVLLVACLALAALAYVIV